MAQGRKHFLINRHTPNETGFPGDLKLGEIAVRHNENAPELIINLLEGGDDSDFRTFIDKVAIINMLSATTIDLQGSIDDVDAKFANYATSAATVAAIKAVQDDVDTVESRVNTLESLSAATQSAIQTIEVSGVTGVKVTKSGTTRTIDFSEMTIDCGTF